MNHTIQMSQQKDEFFKVQEKEGMDGVRKVSKFMVTLENQPYYLFFSRS